MGDAVVSVVVSQELTADGCEEALLLDFDPDPGVARIPGGGSM